MLYARSTERVTRRTHALTRLSRDTPWLAHHVTHLGSPITRHACGRRPRVAASTARGASRRRSRPSAS
eukprot:5484362-Prymnesium_polylepis.1